MRLSFVSRRTLLKALPSAMLSSRAGMLHGAGSHLSSRAFFGTRGDVSKGIYVADWNAQTGALGPFTLAAQLAAPTFLALRQSGSRTFLYSVSETAGQGAVVSSFAVARDAASLRKIASQPTLGDDPTHLSVMPDGRCLAVANYTGGSVTSYRLGADGSISAPVSHLEYPGHGSNAERQTKSHAHSAQFSPDGRFLLVNDLGLDAIHVYRVDAETAKLTPLEPPVWTARAGSGPRHIAFHPNGRWIYSVNELDSTVDILRWHEETGRIKGQGHVSTLPAGFAPNTAFAGEILVSADGRNLYVGNRIAAETIAMLDISGDGAELRLNQLASNGGKLTRHFALDPTGRWMLVANQGSGTVVVLERDAATGKLSVPRHTYPLDSVMFCMWA